MLGRAAPLLPAPDEELQQPTQVEVRDTSEVRELHKVAAACAPAKEKRASGGQARTKEGESIVPGLDVQPISLSSAFTVLGEAANQLTCATLRRTASANLSIPSSPRQTKPLRRSVSMDCALHSIEDSQQTKVQIHGPAAN